MKKLIAGLLIVICVIFIWNLRVPSILLNEQSFSLSVELRKQYMRTFASTDHPPSYTIENVPHIAQLPELPRGCEVTALTMLLHSKNITPDKMELAEKITKVPYEQVGIYGDLNEGFSGDMYSFETKGLGVYVGPIEELAKNYTSNINNLTLAPFEALLHQVSQNNPVWVISNVTFSPLNAERFQKWETKNGTLRVTRAMHAVVIVGYTENEVIINDPLSSSGYTAVNREQFEDAWIEMGQQALTIS
ncbi:MAG: C39 family peptidase [Bacilli bacterium]